MAISFGSVRTPTLRRAATRTLSVERMRQWARRNKPRSYNRNIESPRNSRELREEEQKDASDRGDPGRRHRQGSRARRPSRARESRGEAWNRARARALRLELRLLREDRAHDAGGLVRDPLTVRGDLLRRGRLAGHGARSRLPLGIADPVSPPLRPVRERAPVSPDAGHRLSARGSRAR